MLYLCLVVWLAIIDRLKKNIFDLLSALAGGGGVVEVKGCDPSQRP